MAHNLPEVRRYSTSRVTFFFRPQTGAAFDVVIYGGSSAAVVAAVQVKRMGRSVAIVCPDQPLGGLSSGGLGWTDTGNKAVIGGLARDFYRRVWQHYDRPEAWRWQTRQTYGNRGQGTPAIDGVQRTMWIFEPHVAEAIFEGFMVLGQSAATAAVLALEADQPVQDLPYPKLRERLLRDSRVLEYRPTPGPATQ